MKKNFLRAFTAVAFGFALLIPAASAQLPKLLVIYSLSSPAPDLLATGKFSVVDSFDGDTGTPTLGLLMGYDTILAFTDAIPASGVNLGNVLADAVDAGKPVTVATYGFSNPWEISGRIATAPYAPLVNVLVNGDVSGNLVAVMPSDPIFSGINLGAIVYSHNGNFAHPALAPGAVLLATDGAGINMIARSASGRVMGINLYPEHGVGDNPEFFKLVANVVTNSGAVTVDHTIPTLSEWSLVAMALLLLAVAVPFLRKRRAA
jgi:hypothetical protein